MTPEKVVNSIVRRFHGRPAHSIFTHANDYEWFLGVITRLFEHRYKQGYKDGKEYEEKVKPAIEIKTILGNGYTVRELAKAFNINETTVYQRLARGKGIKKALTETVKRKHYFGNKNRASL